MGPFENQVEAKVTEGTPMIFGNDLRDIDRFVINWQKTKRFYSQSQNAGAGD